MKTKGYAAKSAGALLENYEFNRRELRPRDVALDIYYAGICHSDIHQGLTHVSQFIRTQNNFGVQQNCFSPFH